MVHVPDDERHAEVENKDEESLIESMKARISALEVLVGMLLSNNDDDSETPVEDLEDRISALEEKADSSASNSTITYSQTSARKDKHPFDIICEQKYGQDPKMSVFAPEGCVVVDGANATIPGRDSDGYVEITDLDPEEEAVASVYCHVAKSGEVWNATFDCVENSEAKYTFKIRTFGAYNGDGKSFTMADSVVFITDKTDQTISGTISYIADVIYDEPYHQIKQRTDTKDLATGQVTEGEYEVVTTAVALSSEV